MADMTPELAKKCEQVRKLLDLAAGGKTEAEVAAATAAADRIMQAYRIDQAMLESVDVSKCEPFVELVVSKGGRRTAWREMVLRALCDHYGCAFYFSSYRVGGERSAGAPGSRGIQTYTVVGRKSDADIVDYMFHYLTSEVERLCRWHTGGKGVKYAMAWQMGCSRGIAVQFADMRAVARAQAQAVSSTALAVLDKRGEETRAYIDANLKLKKGVAVHGAHDREASGEGYVVGKTIQIREGLGAGKKTPALDR